MGGGLKAAFLFEQPARLCGTRGLRPIRSWLLLSLAFLGLLLTACTRTAVPFTLPPFPGTVEPTLTLPPPTATAPFGPAVGYDYAVVWIPAGGSLPVRQPAGIAGAQVGTLEADQRGIRLTGNSTFLGSSTWVEVITPEVRGWVNSWNLTQDVSPADFYADARVQSLLERFQQVLLARDGGSLVEVVSPRRGLVLRMDWWNVEVPVSRDLLAGLFVSNQDFDWGESDVAGVPLRGTFREVVLPLLYDVFEGEPEVTCNSLRTGASERIVRWPAEYTNLNFYAFYRPDPLPGSRYNWRTWAVGVEYVEGEPYIAVLVLYHGEI